MSQGRAPWMLVAAYLLLLNGGKVLLLRRYQTGYADGHYSLIAGHVEPHERVTAALVREAAEETGVRVREDHLQFLHVMQRKGADGLVYLDFFFAVEQWEGQVQNGEPSKCDDLRWCSPTELPKNMLPHVREVLIQHWAEAARFSEYGWRRSAQTGAWGDGACRPSDKQP